MSNLNQEVEEWFEDVPEQNLDTITSFLQKQTESILYAEYNSEFKSYSVRMSPDIKRFIQTIVTDSNGNYRKIEGFYTNIGITEVWNPNQEIDSEIFKTTLYEGYIGGKKFHVYRDDVVDALRKISKRITVY